MTLRADGERLRVSAPEEALTPELREEISASRSTLLDWLRRAEASETSSIARAPRDGALPLSFAQQRLWFLEQLQPGTPAYNVPAALGLEGPLDAAALERSLQEIVRRHEVLRTRFVADGDEPVQVVAPELQLKLGRVDLAGLPAAERAAEARRRTAEESLAPFDLERGPLLRATLLRLGEEEHVLLLTMHHIVSDGWSGGVIVRELGALYEAFRNGRPSPLPELPIQYADFAVWQRGWLQGEALERQLGYWRRQLRGVAPVQLPADRPLPARRSFRGAERHRSLPAAVAEGLAALSRQEGTTPYAAALAAFQVLLSRYTGETDVVVGSPIAGRNRSEVEGLVGFFVNTLAMRGDLSGDPSFRELVRRTRETTLEADANQDVPFEKLVEELRPDRDLSQNPIFQVVFAFQNTPRETLELEGLRVVRPDAERSITRFDLEVHLWEAEGGLRATVRYSTDLFDAGTAERLLGHYQSLLESALADPDARLSQLRLLSPAEEKEVIALAGSPDAAAPRAATVLELVEEQVRRTPDAPAVRGGGVEWTYAELDRRADRLAGHLAGLGVGPESRVGVLLERSPDFVATLLGILKAGAAYVPIDLEYPQDRVAYMLADAGTAAVVSRAAYRDRIPEAAREGAVWLDGEAGWPGATAAPAASAGPENLAYVIYTSGSTGQPKGVAIRHGGLMELVEWHRRAYAITGDDRATQLASVGFDACVWELWPYLASGASVAVASDEVRQSPEALRDWLVSERATIGFVPTALGEPLLELDWPPETALRTLLIGGDRLTRFPPESLPFSLVNHYGPTESTVVATCGPVPTTADGRAPSIGRPVGRIRAYLLDSEMRPVPVGVPGELYVGGPHLARGYAGRPGLTAERFVPDPFSAEPGGRLYRTGDVCRYRKGGEIEFVGRADFQVKVRGFRIELGEIEAVLRSHAGVADAVVVARDAAQGSRALSGYFVGEASAEELRELLKRKLPPYMVPAALMRLEALPLSPNGKVDRKALPETGAAGDAAAGAPAPRGPIEAGVAEIFADVLGAGGVAATDDFFALGGHSLLATQVISRLRGTFQVELPLRTLFEAPTVAALAERVEAARRDQSREPPPPVRAVAEDREALPLSFAQQRLWFLDQMGAGSAYNMAFALRLSGPLDAAAFESAVGELVRRHEVLRSCFPEDRGRPTRRPASEPPRLVQVDRTGLDPAQREAEAERLAAEEAQRPFDLATGPLMRATLVAFADDDHTLLLTLHHIATDGWSMGVLGRELSRHYRAFSGDAVAELPEPAVQYADFAAWQRDWLQGEELERQLGFWRDRLAGVPRLQLPTDRRRPADQTYAGAMHTFTFPPELVERLRALSRDCGATLFMVLLAGFDVLLSRYTGQEDVAVGTPIANRHHRELEDLIGFFVNSLVLRTDLSDEPSFRALVGRVRETALEAWDHQDLPFEKLVEELEPERSLDQNPLFQVMFATQTAERPALDLPGVSLRPVRREFTASRFDFEIHISETWEGLSALCLYKTDLFDAATIEALGRRYVSLLEAAVATPDADVFSLPIMSGEERAASLAADRRAFPVAEDRTLHGWFEEQVRRAPDAPALTFEAETLSYAELDRRAAALAERLGRAGVGPDVIAALYLPRSAEMVVAILGILKAGGAYLPLDPAHPPERLAFMLEDSKTPVLVTRSDMLDTLPEARPELVCLDRPGDLEAGASAAGAPPARSQNAAYVIYTSGSTGRPKGVVVTHANAVRLLTATDSWFSFGPSDVWTLFHSVAFDFSVWELWGALLLGGRLVVVPSWMTRSPESFYEMLAAEGVTVLNQTPSAFRQLVQAEASQPPRELALRLVIFGGEALELQSLRPWFDRHGDAQPQLVNMYGITETTVHVTWRPITLEDLDAAPGSVIGGPIPDLEVHLLDRRGEPVPVGVMGEIHVGGAGLARGYLARPGLTAERFVPNPFGGDGERLYRSGDLGRRLPNGDVEYLGRIDDQVKIRGYRIELGEIESALARHPAVREAVALAREDEPGHRRLVAYVAPDAERAPVVRRALRLEREERLPPDSRHDLPNGMTVAHLNRNETEFLYEEIFEDGAYDGVGLSLPDDACIFDVGANIGMFTLYATRGRPRAKVFAFEPIPPVADLLELNAELHDLDVRVLRAGVSNEVSRATFTYYPHVSIFSGRHADAEQERQTVKSFLRNQGVGTPGGDAGGDEALLDELLGDRLDSREVEVPLTTVSEVIREHGVERIDLLKIDAEKSELEVLQGVRPEDWPRIRQVAAEVHDSDGRLARVRALLEEQGFRTDVRQEQSLQDTGLYSVFATRLPADAPAPAGALSPGATDAGDGWASLNGLVADLREHLKVSLPEYMVPAAIVPLESLPLTANGKIDRRRLPAPATTRREAREQAAEPRDAIETTLASIWAAVLKLDSVGVHDNFFELGGDSILSLQIVSRAKEAGIQLTSRDIFRHGTIAELAAVAGTRERQTAEKEEKGGDLPLTPIQRYFVELDLADPDHFNQAVLLELREPGQPERIEAALRHLIEHHDALRLRLERGPDGWRQWQAEATAEVPFEAVDLSGLDAAAQDERMADLAAQLQAGLDLARGPVLRAALFRLGSARADRLLLAIHHVAVDGVSWRVLVEDLGTAVSQLARDERVVLPAKSTSFASWARRLARYATDPAVVAESGFWRETLGAVPTLIDHPGGENSVASEDTVSVSLDADETRALLNEVPAAYRTQINDVLLAALARAAARWSGRRGLLVDLEGHGREEIAEGVDLSRTVGWFTSIFPVLLEADGDEAPGESLKRVKEQLRRIPNRGLGFGVLRYLGPEPVASALRSLPRPEVAFNYLGQFDTPAEGEAWARPAAGERGPTRSPRQRRLHQLEIGGSVAAGRLKMGITYSRNLHRPETVEGLAHGYLDELRGLIEHCRSPEAGGVSPSDFPEARVSQQQLDKVLSMIKRTGGKA